MPFVIEAEGIAFRYPGGIHVVDDWGARFEAGTMSAMTGPSGSGKSTVLAIVGLLHRQTRGEVIVDHVPTAKLGDATRAELRARLFGFVFQDAVLDPSRTVLDNVVEKALYAGWPRRTAMDEARLLLERLGVTLREHHRPGEISGGQAQRVALCRALLGTPRCIIADEPTGNLDPDTRTVVLRTLRERADAGACVIVATHDPVVAEGCDQHIVLRGA